MNGSTMRSRKNSKDTLKQMKKRMQQPKICGEAVLTGKLIASQAYLKKHEKSQINNLTSHLKELGKEQQTKPKVSRRKKIIKITAEINEIDSKKSLKDQ